MFKKMYKQKFKEREKAFEKQVLANNLIIQNLSLIYHRILFSNFFKLRSVKSKI